MEHIQPRVNLNEALRREESVPTSEQKRRRKRKKIAVALAAWEIALGVVNTGINRGSEEPIHYPPIAEQTQPDQNSIVTITANVAGISDLDSQLSYVHNRLNPDFVCLQEVNQSDVQRYMRAFPGYWGEYVMADGYVDFPDGLGDLIISRYRPTASFTEQFDGNFEWVEFGKNLFHRSFFENIRKSRKENRAAIAIHVNVPMENGPELSTYVISTHLAAPGGPGEHQFESLRRFVDDDVASNKNALTIVAGDLNRTPTQIRPDLKRVYIPDIGPTSHNRQIDYVMITPTIKVDSKTKAYAKINTKLVPQLKTDHTAGMGVINISWLNRHNPTNQ